ncbi:MurR/RpiR family transcriptional regulator [Lacticaseibacillus pabuli]|uniref:MurR/RpiR family transcriptional regulator n=1 Tax=Lacticaseibacillus pabuli TaxID=3025672 RepID=A0ABY7WQD4_9LACO|nr:MurR/RpiR family transcriptional regulator [Lacticaseibacillus sp. KACC 23028]WDF82394.1 MurR/RpiR family transcriptional regulator [Lacticaseibacillus sp. KACC 23028]
MDYDYLIHNHFDDLTKSERKVADYILEKGKDIIYATLTDVKSATHVGDATIIRFCQKLGFNGFSDFKIEIAKEDYTVSQKNEPADEVDNRASDLSNVIISTAKLMDRSRLDAAVKMMSKAETIYIFGVGGSGQIAESLAAILLRDGVQSQPVRDPHFQAQLASLMKPGALVIGFSLTGRTKDTFDSLTIAKDNGAKIIAVTNYENTPIAKLSDVVLQTSVNEFLNGGSVAGRISQLYICDLLAKGYEAMNNVDAATIRANVLRSIIGKSID